MRAGKLFALAALAAGLPIGNGLAFGAVVILTATLSGANEVSPGDPDGSGKFSVEIDPEMGDFCYTLTTDKTGKASGAHVHSGAPGINGAVVVTLQVASDMCIAVEPDKLKPMVQKPEDYYVNVHTAAHPEGAVRGQLVKK
jgi:hypothetical protein